MPVEPNTKCLDSNRHRRNAMTTGWLIVNLVLVAVVAAIVAVPAVLIPNLLDRDARLRVRGPSTRTAQQPARPRGWANEGRRADAA
jgi:hypothetical protein